MTHAETKKKIVAAFKAKNVAVRIRVFKYCDHAMYRVCVIRELSHWDHIVKAVTKEVGAYSSVINQDWELYLRIKN